MSDQVKDEASEVQKKAGASPTALYGCLTAIVFLTLGIVISWLIVF